MSSYQHDRHFTLDEASQMLPWLIGIVAQIIVLFEKMKSIGFDIVNETWTPSGNGHQDGPPPEEFQNFLELVAKLDREGLIIRNFRKGVVDFPHINKNGQEVYLCWMYGEERIEHWHEIPHGFMGREKLS